mmetsp:Transcript_45642/g.71512  ORF Transcript_45642/g.71512 Transcript_45642/m.71512 type:complete len:193 (+) Transcript_45642:52-630(+)|eukprot:CAMPEP_0184293418 /NCGR_PEP_ID=MMETSP1049-20130417/4847_1 /TAXON_ID=77928 /ORGANISM="Proteomonas sulcata, Strain CCMP704" /LENGTH=192 /DNA_ID=CAMNT_0026601385 /DNA_START=40 /DNA_END=618 /DNA_ORIENTATION=-
MPVDYSKWDNLDDSDEDESSGRGRAGQAEGAGPHENKSVEMFKGMSSNFSKFTQFETAKRDKPLDQMLQEFDNLEVHDSSQSGIPNDVHIELREMPPEASQGGPRFCYLGILSGAKNSPKLINGVLWNDKYEDVVEDICRSLMQTLLGAYSEPDVTRTRPAKITISDVQLAKGMQRTMCRAYGTSVDPDSDP